MTRTIRTLSLVAAAGGAAWLAKVAVIAASDDSVLEPVLYILGVLLLCIGAAAVTLRFARGTATKVAASVAAPVLAILSYMALDAIAKPLVGDAGPAWLADEAGIVLTGAVWLVIGLVSAQRATASRWELAAITAGSRSTARAHSSAAGSSSSNRSMP